MAEVWTYYNAKGKRVRRQQAVFAGKEVVVDTGVPAPPGHASMHGVEYHDVHVLTAPDDRRHFRSRSHMLRWFEDVASTDPRR